MGFSFEILGLIIEILGIVSGSLELCLKLGFDPGTDVLRFCCVIAGKKMNNKLFVWSGTEFLDSYVAL